MSPSSDSVRRVAVRTLGCKVNRVESEQVAAELLGEGIEVVEEDDAEVVVVNTCTVTAEADAKARKAVRRALKAAREPIVVVTGCLATLDAPGLTALGDRVIVEADKGRVAKRVTLALKGPTQRATDAMRTRGEGLASAPTTFRTRVPVKIEDGCDAFCSYCIVPYARGVPRSTPLEDVVHTVEALVTAGTREIVLTGINLGRYGDAAVLGDTVDTPAGVPADLAALIEAVASTGIERIRLSSIEPVDLTDRLLGVLASTPQICPHLHVPLQSGCDRILGIMRRTYSSAEYADRIRAARAVLTGVAITTDVIAGFPTETDEEAQETLAFVDAIGFSRLHVFRYSERVGTPACELKPGVPPRERAARAEVLRDAGDRLSAAHRDRRRGGRGLVLVERADGQCASGTTGDYLSTRIIGLERWHEGDVVEVALVGDECGVMLAEPLVADGPRDLREDVSTAGAW